MASQTKPLIYKPSDTHTSQAPHLETTLTIYPTNPSTPSRIPFRIHLQSEFLDPTANDESLYISLGLCKHTWTKGISTSVGSEEGHDFPGIIVGSLKLDRPDPKRGVIEVGNARGDREKGAGGGELVVEGEYQVEEDEVTAQGCGIRLSVSSC